MQELDYETVDLNINMGPQHPSTHGVFRMVLTVDGEVVVDVVPVIGYMHRGGEKLLENLDYRQGIGIMDRTDYLAQFSGEQVFCMAAEKLYGFEVPERAEYLRVICVELNRIASHMMFMGAYGADSGVLGTTFTYGFVQRERIQRIFERLTGERLMYNYFRVGGVAWEPYEGFDRDIREVIPLLKQGIGDLNGLLTTNEIFIERTRNIGIMTPEQAIAWGQTGPMLRATGVTYDIRKDEPYSIYDRFAFDIPTGTHGDCYDRYLVRLEEMLQSIRIIEQALDQLPRSGPLMPDKYPRMLRLPVGEVYTNVESPRGDYGIYLVSKGGNKPYRCHVRSPCFSNLSGLREMTVGEYVADAVMILGSTDIVLCEVDR